jgi:uncharacterized repeat protein (TIGR03803 family)
MKPFLAIAMILLLPARIAAQAQFETIYKFSGPPDGSAPQGLAAGPQGVLYGMTAHGGSASYGTVFQLTPPSSPGGMWTKSTLYEFTGAYGSGANPVSAPVVGKDGSIYGATSGSVYVYNSTIFQLQPPAAPGGAWVETALYPPSEDYPAAEFNHGLIAGPNGELYAAGSTGGYYHCGAVVGLTPPSVTGKWSVSFEYDFPGGNSGCNPAGIALSADGVVYGVATYGGTSNQGMVFALSPSPVPYQYIETVLYNFTGGADGGLPSQPPILAPVQIAGAAFAIYGTTASGGPQDLGGVFELVPDYDTGTWTAYFPFSFSSGKIPSSALLESNGEFYGATATGAVYTDAGGSIFQLYPYDQFLDETVLHSFEGPAGPSGNLIMSKNGVLYGTTVSGPGPAGFGTVYRVKP